VTISEDSAGGSESNVSVEAGQMSQAK
jgi:hypothetical protein